MTVADRTVEALVLDVTDAGTTLDAVRARVDALRAYGVEVALFVPSAEADAPCPDRQLLAGRLFLGSADGSAVHQVTVGNARCIWRHPGAHCHVAGDPRMEAVAFLLDAFAARGVSGSLVVDARGAGAADLDELLDAQLRRRSDRRVPDVDRDPEWLVVIDGDGPTSARAKESLLTLADGVVGVRGSHEEGDPEEAPLVVAAGAYAGDGADEHLMAAPSTLSLDLERPPRTVRLLDLRSGMLLREDEAAPSGLRTARFLALGRRGLLAMRAEGDTSRLAPGPCVQQVTERVLVAGRTEGVTWGRTSAEHGGITVAVTDRSVDHEGRRVVERLSAFVVGREHAPAARRAVEAVRQADELGFDRVLAEHRAEWAKRWRDVDVRIPDDPAAQLAVRFALFHLWGGVAFSGESAVGARGLTGPGYAGHVFWDTDVFVLPAIASMSPHAARTMLEYRIRRLPAARALARQRGLDGARFPWESASLGTDVTPTSGRANGEWVPIMTGNLEEHIAGDVAWAASHYADWCGDSDFLAGPGHPLVVDAARYWASRIWTDDEGAGLIRHVIGPDEYHENVDDNCYTNVLARWNLRRAAELEAGSPDSGAWRRLADHLVDGYDPATHVHEQFAGYHDLEPMLIADVGRPPIAADLLLGGKRTAAAQIIKQADVVMAHHVLPDELPAESLAADLDYYLPRMAHGSSLSPAVTAAVLARAGRPDEALDLLDIALRLDLDDLTGMTASGLHLATLAGVWQALLFGFLGARVRGGALLLDPVLPRRWPTLGLRFRCRGRRVTVTASSTETTVTVDRPMTIGTGAADAVRATRPVRMHRRGSVWEVVP